MSRWKTSDSKYYTKIVILMYRLGVISEAELKELYADSYSRVDVSYDIFGRGN
jgi:hypothetical protein